MSEIISVEDFDIFKEAMIEENLALQIDIVKKLESLANALGQKATREELLPFIKIHIDLHDELLLNLSEQLKHFIPLVGGVEHSQIIFDILARLCNTDENIVREKAVETLIYIGKEFNSQQIEEMILPVLNQLINDDWFTSKCSAVMLFSTFYPKLSTEKKAELRNSLKILIQDDSPMVRKASAMAFVDFVTVLEEDILKKEFIPIFCDIGQDPMDSVRSVTIDIALALAKRLGENDLDDSIFKMVENASDDPSWRLRQRLANSIANLQQHIPFGKYRGKLIALFQKLTQDMEPEVRILAAGNFFHYCKYLLDSYKSQTQNENNFEPVFEQSILPIIHRVAVDDNEDVRLALSSTILALSSILSEDCFKKNIVPFLLNVLDNEESMAIQANFLLGLSSVSSNLDLTKSLNAIKNAVRAVIVRSHSNWRTRRSILTTFVDISKFCSADYFSDHFKIYYAALLGDSVFAVRRSASVIIPLLAKHYGIKWASDHLVPYFTMFARDSRYLYRFVSLFGISEIVKPYLCVNPDSYLKDFRTIIDNKEHANNKKAILTLAKIVKTSHLVEKELKGPTYAVLLKLKDNLDYLSTFDINIYAEKYFTTLRERYENINVYAINEEDFKENNCPYLQGILGLIYNKFLPIIETLNKDITENIQIRAICTLDEISEFITKLNKEIEQPWVKNSLKCLTEEEMSAIKDEIHHELKTANLEEEPEKIDTNLMENSNEPDLTKTIYIENSNLSENKEINKNIGKNENDLDLVKEVLDILDKKISDGSGKSNKEEGNSEKGSLQGPSINKSSLEEMKFKSDLPQDPTNKSSSEDIKSKNNLLQDPLNKTSERDIKSKDNSSQEPSSSNKDLQKK